MMPFNQAFSFGRTLDDQRFRQGLGGIRDWSEIYKPIQAPSYPEPPQDLASYEELPEHLKRQGKKDMLLAVAAALGQADDGNLGSGFARAAGQLQGRREDLLAGENARRQEAYGREMGLADRKARLVDLERENADRMQKAKATFETWRQAEGSIDVRDRPLLRQATALAQAGDLSGLQRLIGEAPNRKALLDRGVDPDDDLQVALHKQRQQEQGQLEGRIAELKAVGPLQIEQSLAEQKALLPGRLAETAAEAKIRAQHSPSGGSGGRNLEGRVVQAEDGTYMVIDQTQYGVATGPDGRPIRGKRDEISETESKALQFLDNEEDAYNKLSPSEKDQWNRQNRSRGFDRKKRYPEILGELRGMVGAAAPEGNGAPGTTGSEEKVRTSVVDRVSLVEKNVPGLPPDKRGLVLRQIAGGTPAAAIVREMRIDPLFPGLTAEQRRDVEDDIRKGRTADQIIQALRLAGAR
jgi:hypothetical protein